MLEIRQLVKVYPGPVAALTGIDLEVGNGMFGLLGPNGAGKTTLMQVVAGVLEPTSGEVWLDGEEVTSQPQKVREKLGYLPQDFGFYPQLSGRAMLQHLLRLKGVTSAKSERKLCDELLQRVNLADAAQQKVGGYSGGMRQRLGVAQAIAGNPRILVVDEPTAGLDPEERQRFYHLLAELAEERIVLLSTHIVEDVSVLCPHFAIIHRGALRARTTPARARAAIAGTIFEGAVAAEGSGADSGTFTVIEKVVQEGRHRVRIYQPDGCPPDGFVPVEASLEHAYLTAVKAGGHTVCATEASHAGSGVA